MGRGATRAPASPFFGLRTGKGRARTRDTAERLPTLSPQAARARSLSRRPGTPVLQREIALGSPKPWAPGAVLTPPMVFLGRERPPPGTRAAIPHCSLREVRADGVTGPQRGWGQAPGSGPGPSVLSQCRSHIHLWSRSQTRMHANHPLIWSEVRSGTRPLPHTRSQSESESLIAVWGVAGMVTPRKVRRAPSPRCPCTAAAPAAGSATGHLPPRGQAARSPGRCRESRQR